MDDFYHNCWRKLDPESWLLDKIRAPGNGSICHPYKKETFCFSDTRIKIITQNSVRNIVMSILRVSERNCLLELVLNAKWYVVPVHCGQSYPYSSNSLAWAYKQHFFFKFLLNFPVPMSLLVRVFSHINRNQTRTKRKSLLKWNLSYKNPNTFCRRNVQL